MTLTTAYALPSVFPLLETIGPIGQKHRLRIQEVDFRLTCVAQKRLLFASTQSGFYYYLAGSASNQKIQDQSISSRSRVYHLYKSFSFTEKRPPKPETGVKEGFEEVKHEFPFGIFRPERQDYLFRCSAAPQVIDIDPRWTILDGTSERKTWLFLLKARASIVTYV